ncbi:MAG: hypothetical protein SFW67_35540 [Myxococcaceae bacterium]|nr:hypothetical protein [Myxococcaceae bacterium]
MEPVSAIIAGASALLGPIIGAIGRALAEGDFREARRLRQQIADSYGDNLLPVLDDLVAQEVGPSAFEALREDAGLRNEATSTMRELRNVYENEGMGAADEAALQLAQRAGSNQAAGQYQGLAAGARQRLGANSGVLAALYSQAGQQAAAVTGEQALQAQVSARQRALQALQAGGELARGIRSDDYRAASDKASSQDAISQFNAEARTRTALANNEVEQTRYGNRLTLLDRRNDALRDVADDYVNRGNQTVATASGIGQGVTQAGSAAADMFRRRR